MRQKFWELVEPIPKDVQWRRTGDKGNRLWIGLRHRDLSAKYALMEGTGVPEAAFDRETHQIGLAVRSAMRNPDNIEDDQFWRDLGAAIASIITRQELEPSQNAP